jgi:hypothetical protein
MDETVTKRALSGPLLGTCSACALMSFQSICESPGAMMQATYRSAAAEA